MIHLDTASQTIVFTPVGIFDHRGVDSYRSQLDRALAEGFRRAVFEFSATQWITSSGLGFLIEAFKMAEERGATFRLASPNETIRALLRETKLDRLFGEGQASDAEEVAALAALNRAMADDIRILERLNEIEARILLLDDPEAIAEESLRGLLAALGAERGAFFRFDADSQSLRMALGFGTGLEASEDLRAFGLNGRSLEGRAIADRKALGIGAGSLTQEDSPLLARLGFASAVLAPVAGGAETTGLLVADLGHGDRRHVQNMAALVQSFGSLFGAALEKARLLRSLEERNQRVSAALSELTQAQIALNDSAKLATLGALVSGLGHTFNNLLVPILGYSETLARKVADIPKAERQLHTIRDSAAELKRLIERLMRITRDKPPDVRACNLNETIESAMAMTERLLDEQNIRVEKSLAVDLPALPLDRDLIVQTFLAIFHRAQHCFPHGATDKWLRVSTRRVGEDGWIEAVVEDNGFTVDDSQREATLDPLAPLQRVGAEEVFNLSVPANIVRKHGGKFEVSSNGESGSLVRIELPRKEKVASLPGFIG